MLVLIVAIVLLVPVSLWYAFAAATLWGWFIVPVFPLPALSMWQMWGITMLLGVMHPRRFDPYQDERGVDWSKVGNFLLVPAVVLGLGAGLKFWVLGE